MAVAVVFALGAPGTAHASIADDIADKNRLIEELERQRDEYQRQADALGHESQTLKNEIAKLNARINSVTVQIRTLEASIERTDLEITDTEAQITEAERQVGVHRDALSRYLREYQEYDELSLAAIVLQSRQISDLFDHLNNLERTQEQLQATIGTIRGLQLELGEHRETLQVKQQDLEHMRGLQELEQRSLATDRGRVSRILNETQGQEARYQQLVQTAQRDINRLREQIEYLLRSGISAEDAVKYAELAAIGAGIRPAFLLALLEVESRLGQNVGTGNWQDDMVQCYYRLATIYYPHRKDYYLKRMETEKNAFLAITGKLGLDPNTVKVSREPTYGCGGAMGPAQFIPSTWLSYENDVIRITGHNPPNPWNFHDAFTAAAVKLARGGATTRAGEEGAARAYVGGSTTCGIGNPSHICTTYSRTVLQKAAQIEQNL